MYQTKKSSSKFPEYPHQLGREGKEFEAGKIPKRKSRKSAWDKARISKGGK